MEFSLGDAQEALALHEMASTHTGSTPRYRLHLARMHACAGICDLRG